MYDTNTVSSILRSYVFPADCHIRTLMAFEKRADRWSLAQLQQTSCIDSTPYFLSYSDDITAVKRPNMCIESV